MKIKKGSKVKYEGRIGKVHSLINFPFVTENFNQDGHAAYVDFKSPSGNEYWKLVFINELKLAS